jgi:hypothetical protein
MTKITYTSMPYSQKLSIEVIAMKGLNNLSLTMKSINSDGLGYNLHSISLSKKKSTTFL